MYYPASLSVYLGDSIEGGGLKRDLDKLQLSFELHSFTLSREIRWIDQRKSFKPTLHRPRIRELVTDRIFIALIILVEKFDALLIARTVEESLHLETRPLALLPAGGLAHPDLGHAVQLGLVTDPRLNND